MVGGVSILAEKRGHFYWAWNIPFCNCTASTRDVSFISHFLYFTFAWEKGSSLHMGVFNMYYCKCIDEKENISLINLLQYVLKNSRLFWGKQCTLTTRIVFCEYICYFIFKATFLLYQSRIEAVPIAEMQTVIIKTANLFLFMPTQTTMKSKQLDWFRQSRSLFATLCINHCTCSIMNTSQITKCLILKNAVT